MIRGKAITVEAVFTTLHDSQSEQTNNDRESDTAFRETEHPSSSFVVDYMLSV